MAGHFDVFDNKQIDSKLNISLSCFPETKLNSFTFWLSKLKKRFFLTLIHLELSIRDYRPISILLLLLKSFECLLVKCLNTFAETNDLFPSLKCSFCKVLSSCDDLLTIAGTVQNFLDTGYEVHMIVDLILPMITSVVRPLPSHIARWELVQLSLTPPWQAVQRMYHRYNVSVFRQYSICTTEAIPDNCFTKLVFYDLPCLSFGCIIFQHCQHCKKMGIAEEEGGSSVLTLTF